MRVTRISSHLSLPSAWYSSPGTCRPLSWHQVRSLILHTFICVDGLWDVMGDQEVVDQLYEQRSQGRSAKDIATDLTAACANRPGSDNVTIMLLFFRWPEPPSS